MQGVSAPTPTCTVQNTGVMILLFIHWNPQPQVSKNGSQSRVRPLRRECKRSGMGTVKNETTAWGLGWGPGQARSSAWLGLNSRPWQWPSWPGFLTWLARTAASGAGRCVCIGVPACQGLGKQMFLSVRGDWRELRRGRWRRKQLEF